MIISAVKRLPFWRAYTTKANTRYWLKKTDPEYWKEYQKTWNHPHRTIISAALNQMEWGSLFEIGCGSGSNLINIVKNHPNKQIGGSDVNSIAIQVARKALVGALLQVGPGNNIMMSDKSSDVVLSDMFLIYVGPWKIKEYLKEVSRIARNYVILREFHSSSVFDRWKLRIFSGRHSYNYKKLLSKLGFYDIQIYKLSKVEDNEDEFRHLIIAKI